MPEPWLTEKKDLRVRSSRGKKPEKTDMQNALKMRAQKESIFKVWEEYKKKKGFVLGGRTGKGENCIQTTAGGPATQR